jgi:hypothetical protein
MPEMTTLTIQLDLVVYEWLHRTAQATECSVERIVQAFVLDHMNGLCRYYGDTAGLEALHGARERMGVRETSLLLPERA